ncbi:threonine synthase [Candidatus Hecatella orcuttiae]|uniref:threonine synthase n=1 Tax=Candidatus Hecatella orcuttiae TaxID=1935119 RepID=UPI002867E50B|nr:threonine synthase [Candidatus Hecatella orcuttiae]
MTAKWGVGLEKKIFLKCRECGREYPPVRLYACEDCFGPLEVVYDLDSLSLRRSSFEGKPKNLWRYFELLPINDKANIVNLEAGYTILHKSSRLAEMLGLKNLYIKDDTVNPTYSFKDRPTSVAVSKALEFGVQAVGCASTGNLACATAAHAAKAGLPCYVFVPSDIEMNKIVQISVYGARIVAIKGTYDDANTLAAQACETYGWALVNINMRPYYVEGSKTLAFEVCEQLNWEPPDHVIVPTASGALLCAIAKGFEELHRLGLISRNDVRISSAQPAGCAPIVSAFKAGSLEVTPIEHPETIAKSLAIGDPADGVYALKTIRESGGVGEDATDEEISEGVQLLAKTEGVFAEPAGGVVIAALKKMVEQGDIQPDERVVCYITGNGLKTPEAVSEILAQPTEIEPRMDSLKNIIDLKGGEG